MSEKTGPHPDDSPRGIPGAEPTSQIRGPEGGASPRLRSPGALAGSHVAHARVAVELTEAEKDALARALERRFGRPVQLDVEIDSRIVGGVWVQVGDTIIDGSLQGRLEALRHQLRTSNRALVLHSMRSVPPEGGQA